MQGTSFYDDSMDGKHLHESKHNQLKKYTQLVEKFQKIKQKRIR